ncbi:MAG: gliding motility protein GldM [bacterium]|nr:gliding motility protein GldM [bacterium]
MSNQTLTPRQRMINMMYLVLIAMLALNVSREILKSFYLFELSFNNANKNADVRNLETMSAFQAKMNNERTRQKTEKWYQLAKDAHQISSDFDTYVEQMKKDIIKNGGGRIEPEANQKGLTELSLPDDMEKHANYFDAQGLGNGALLKGKINETRNKLLALLKTTRGGPMVMAALDKSTPLKAEDPKTGDLEHKTWESIYLVEAPLAGVVTLLSKTQNDCKSLEADVLSVLSDNINTTLTQTDQRALIIPESKYVMSGSTFKARIALATFDKTAPQKIIVNGNSIPVDGGLGMYTFAASGIGSHKVEAKIETVDPLTGNTIFVDAEPIEWSSFQPSAAISADAMNVLFVGLDNPMSISVPGVTPENTIVTASSGVTLAKSGSGKFIAKAAVGTKSAVITVSARMDDGQIKKMGESTYKVRRVPQPKLKVGSLVAGTYPKVKILLQKTVNATLEDFYFSNLNYTVIKYTAVLDSKRDGAIIKEVQGNSAEIIKGLVNRSKSGESIYLENIVASGPGGNFYLDPITIKIQ